MPLICLCHTRMGTICLLFLLNRNDSNIYASGGVGKRMCGGVRKLHSSFYRLKGRIKLRRIRIFSHLFDLQIAHE